MKKQIISAIVNKIITVLLTIITIVTIIFSSEATERTTEVHIKLQDLTSKNNTIDEHSLKQSDWWRNVQKKIREQGC